MSSHSEDQTTLDDLMLIAEKINGLLKDWGIDEIHFPKFLEALTHKSFIHENSDFQGASYQRLEFLGDSVLGLFVTTELYLRHPTLPEGELSKLKSFIVREETLAQMARAIGLNEMMLVGKGEQNDLVDNDSIMADGLEALLGAVYVSQGVERARVVWESWIKKLDGDLFSLQNLVEFDAKSKLQEFCLKAWKTLPVYEAQEFKNKFRVTLIIQDKALLSREDVSKKKAALVLAQSCLKYQLHLTV